MTHDSHHVDVDDRALDAARRALGTKGLSETVNAALREAIQLLLAPDSDHRRVPPADLPLAAAAEAADVPLVHHDRDYERVATVTDLQHRWMATDGSLA